MKTALVAFAFVSSSLGLNIKDRTSQQHPNWPVGYFECNDIEILNIFNESYGKYTESGVEKYYADQVTYACESTPHDEGHDTVNILHYKEPDADGINANMLNEYRDCQRYTFQSGTRPQADEGDEDNAPCNEGTSCKGCLNPPVENNVGNVHIARECVQRNGEGAGTCVTRKCKVVASCCPYWPEC
eukprot:TRINITY_DN84147_c0_g1_i1.p1 TRINITY_DN84147_c0_g1~~TRINITY_DN84147_c0_g1_i1.p1  ORF type:complete len:186 (-),score=30.61 TRINITY_DN84147_c0_g1_i1:136-693(-)